MNETIFQIAKKLGYCRATVSAIVNGRGSNQEVRDYLIRSGFVKCKLNDVVYERNYLDILILKGNFWPYFKTLYETNSKCLLPSANQRCVTVRFREYKCEAAIVCQEMVPIDELLEYAQPCFLLDPPEDQLIYDSVRTPYPEVSAKLISLLLKCYHPLRPIQIKVFE